MGENKDHIEAWSLDEAVTRHDCDRSVPAAGTGNLMARKDRTPRPHLTGLDDEVQPRDPAIVFCLPVIDSGSRRTSYGPMVPNGHVDGLMLMLVDAKGTENTFRRIGIFREAKKEVFDNLERIKITLV